MKKQLPEMLKKIKEAKSNQPMFDSFDTQNPNWERLRQDQSLADIPKKIKENKDVDILIKEAQKRLQSDKPFKEVLQETINPPATKPTTTIPPKKITPEINPSTEEFLKTREIVKNGKKSGKGKIGLLTALAGLGISSFAPESKAAEVIGQLSEAAAEADPSTHLQSALESSEPEFQALLQKIKEKQNEQKNIKEEITPVIKQLGGPADISPNKISKMVGEQDSPDIEQPALNYQDYLQKQKKRMGY